MLANITRLGECNVLFESDEISMLYRLYDEALAFYNGKRYCQALEVLEKLRKKNSVWLRPVLLQVYIMRAMKCPVQEMELLQHLLAQGEKLPVSSDGDKDILAEAWSLLGEVLVKLGECSLAVDAFLQSSAWERDWQKKCEEYSNGIFAANYCSGISDERWQELYAGYRMLLRGIEPLQLGTLENGSYGHKKIRVGYLSADLVCHPVAYFLYPLLEHFDRAEFQVYLYRVNSAEDKVTEQLQNFVDCMRVVSGLGYKEIAEQIALDEIDVLVDLSGHTKDNRLPVLAYRPAPVILSGIGYFNSLGMSIDGFLSDVYCSPEERHPAFVERLLRLPHTHFCYHPFNEFPAIAGKMAWERNGYVTFGCFNNFSKVTDEMLMVWCRILHVCADSRLLLKHQLFDSDEGREWTVQRMRRLGLPVERIELRGFSPVYLQEYHDIDIAFDTYPYTGGLTTIEALYMGVPVVSRYGSRHGTRFGLSFLSNLGLPELVAGGVDEYVNITVRLAADKDLLCLLHQELRNLLCYSNLMDGKSYCREMEKLYKGFIKL